MNKHDMTLAEFFLSENQSLEDTKKSLLTVEEYTKELQVKLANEEKNISLSLFVDELAEELLGLLNIELKSIMVNSWNKYRLFHKYMDKSKNSPDEKILLPLAEHTIKSKYKPKIKVVFNAEETATYTVAFEIDIQLKLKGFILVIKNQKIRKIQTGNCKASGTVKCEGAVLMKKDLVKISLPDTIILEEEEGKII